MPARLLIVLVIGLAAGGIASSLFWRTNANLLAPPATVEPEDKLEREPEPQPAGDRRDPGEVEARRQPGSLRDLRALLTERPTRRQRAALWRAVENMSLADLNRLYRETWASKNRDWLGGEIAGVLLERLADLDPRAAAELIAVLEGEELANAARTLLPGLAAIDPRRAVEFYQEMGREEKAALGLKAIIQSLAEASLETAKETVEKIDIEDRARAYGILAEVVSATDPAGALDLLQSLPAGDLVKGLESPAVIDRLAAHDPEETARLLDRLPRTGTSGAKLARLAEIWAASDPVRALRWANGIELEAVRLQAQSLLYPAWARTDPERALEALDEIEDPASRLRIFGGVAREVIRKDPEGAVDWVRTLEGDERSRALSLLGSEVASINPERGVAFLEEAMESGGVPLVIPSNEIGYAYALRDPAAAVEWVRELPVGTAQEHAAAGVARALIGSDPVATAEFIGTLPDGDTRNRSIGHLIDGIRGADPARAFQWASSVEGDPARRFDFLARAIDSWKIYSPEQTREAIRNLNIAEDERERLLGRVW